MVADPRDFRDDHHREVDRPYWDSIGAELQTRLPNPAWRAFCDDLNDRWLKQALGGRSYRRALKTDLFEEALGGGVALETAADHVVGVDVAVATAQLAMQRRGVPPVAADVRQLPFRDGAFDLVISLSTLDHFSVADDIFVALREIHRVLAPGGRLMLTLDNLSNPFVRLRNCLPWSLLSRTGLVPYYVGATLTYGQLDRALAATQFRVLHSTALMHVPRVLAVPLARILKPLWGSMEVLQRLPTRYRTGLFVAVVAEALKGSG